MSAKNVKLIVAYDGTHYLGWQKTPTGPSIEEELEKVLVHILQQKIHLQAASRTDAGVHATGQVVNFFTSHPDLDPGKLRKGINALLPKDIAVLEVEWMPDAFHPTIDAKSKEYVYQLCWGPVQWPQQRFYEWHIPHQLNFNAMQAAAQKLSGTLDYAAFCNTKKNEEYAHHVREVESIILQEAPHQRLLITIKGKHFLYKMVRNIVGTLVYISQNKILIDNLDKIIEDGDRTKAGMTAPAHGLSLSHVFY